MNNNNLMDFIEEKRLKIVINAQDQIIVIHESLYEPLAINELRY